MVRRRGHCVVYGLNAGRGIGKKSGANVRGEISPLNKAERKPVSVMSNWSYRSDSLPSRQTMRQEFGSPKTCQHRVPPLSSYANGNSPSGAGYLRNGAEYSGY